MSTLRFFLIVILVTGAIACPADNNLVGTNPAQSDGAAAGAAAKPDASANGGSAAGGAVGSGGAVGGVTGTVGAVSSGGAAGEVTGTAGGAAGSGGAVGGVTGTAGAVGSGGAAGGTSGTGGAVGSGGAAGGASSATCASLGDPCTNLHCCGPLICYTSASSPTCVEAFGPPPDSGASAGGAGGVGGSTGTGGTGGIAGRDGGVGGGGGGNTAATCALRDESCATRSCCEPLLCRNSMGSSTCFESYGPPPDSGIGGAGGVVLTASVGKASTGADAVIAQWQNGTNQSIFLRGCSSVDGEYLDASGTWNLQGGIILCGTVGTAVEVVPGGARTQSGWLPNYGVGTWRFTGPYGVGCTPGTPFSNTNCAQLFQVTSNTFTWPLLSDGGTPDAAGAGRDGAVLTGE